MLQKTISKTRHVINNHGFKKILLKAARRCLLRVFGLAIDLNPLYIFTKFTRGHAVRTVNGYRMYLPLWHDAGLSKDLFIFGKREHLSTDYMSTSGIIRPGDTVLDIGANIGYYALLESKLAGSGGRVIALEPVSANLELLKKNISINKAKNIETFKLAAGIKKKKEMINVPKKRNHSSIIPADGKVYEERESVEMVSVDGFLQEIQAMPSFIRMDVEGYEKEIISGMQKTLSGSKPKMFIEVHPGAMTIEELGGMFEIFARCGYKEAVVIKGIDECWLNKKGKIRPVLKYLTSKIEGDVLVPGMGMVQHFSVEEILRKIHNKQNTFRMFIS